MILIPEIETVVILVPRTGSGSLRRAISERYPRSMLLYRHMEADGVPQGYDRWKKVGIVRDPLDRLWSLYNYLRNFTGDYEPHYAQAMRESVQMRFSDWVRFNTTVFTCPYDFSGQGRFFANYTVRHPVPENLKSQFVYLRPDLGTEIYRYDEAHLLHERLGVKPGADKNRTRDGTRPFVTAAAQEHIEKHFAWDIAMTRSDIIEERAA
jgi:hypothetical protein